VAKDRARPFSRKHLRYWMTVTGGMLLIGGINVAIGYALWPGEPKPPEPILFDVPQVTGEPARLHPIDAGLDPDAGIDSTPR